MPTPEVRRSTVEDAPAIAGIRVRAWRSAYRGMLPDDVLDGLTPELATPSTRALLASLPGESASWLALVDGRAVGFVAFGPYRLDSAALDSPMHATEGEVRAIYVEPDAWGTGAGRALMETALRELSAQGRFLVRLWVLSANERARGFYERLGFVADGETGLFRIERGGDPPVEVDEVRYVLDGRLG